MVWVQPRGARRLWALVCLGVLAAAGPAGSQEQPPVFELPEVVVPGRRPQPLATTPASVGVITREEIQRLGARTVADVLALVPEVVVRTYGGLGALAQVSIRGSTPSQVLVLLDGVPLNSVALGQADLSTISVDAVERIEVLRGPFSAIHGSGAVGGVVNIVTGAPRRRQASVRTGGYGQQSAVLTLPSEAGSWQVTATVDATPGHRVNSDYAGTTVVARLTPSAPVALTAHYYAADLGVPGDTAFPTPTDRQRERRTVLQATGGSQGASSWRLYSVSDDFTFDSAFGLSTYASRLWGGEAQRRWQTPGGLITAGLDAQSQSLDAVVFGSAVVADATVAAGYLQYDAAFSDRVLGSVGLRVDSHSVYGATLNPRAGVVYQLDGATRLWAAAGRTFRGPTFLELYFPGCSNPALQPETAWAAEVGVERRTGGSMLSATAFGTWATNLIAGGCPPSNVGQATVRGLSVESRVRAGEAVLSAALTALQAVDAAGAPLLRVPGVTAQVTVSRPLAGGDLTVLASYVGPRPDLDPATFTTVQMPGYVDVRVRYRMVRSGGPVLTVGVDNALDGQYEPVAGYPAPGRTVFVTASWEW